MKKYKKIKKERVLTAIKVCTNLENAWGNNRYPGETHKNEVIKMRKLLEEFLSVNVHVKKNKKSKSQSNKDK